MRAGHGEGDSISPGKLARERPWGPDRPEGIFGAAVELRRRSAPARAIPGMPPRLAWTPTRQTRDQYWVCLCGSAPPIRTSLNVSRHYHGWPCPLYRNSALGTEVPTSATNRGC